MSAPAPIVEFWFEFASTYSYLSAMRVDEVATKAGVAVDWKPFLLGPIFGAQGWQTSPFNIYPDKGAHMWRDMARRSAASGLTFKQPDPFPQNSLLASRLTLVGLEEGWGEAFARGVYEVEFAHGLNISSERVLEGLLIKAGADPRHATSHHDIPGDSSSRLMVGGFHRLTAVAGWPGVFSPGSSIVVSPRHAV